MNNIINLNTVDLVFSSKDIILLDTNIWIYLFYPLGNYGIKTSNKYSSIYKKIINSKSKVIVPATVISEIFNTCLRFEFSLLKDLDSKKYKDFKKDFRGTEEYQKSVEKLSETIKNIILKNSTVVNDLFEYINIDNILVIDEEFDFNDKLIIEICKKYGAKLLTHDKDFKKYKIDFPLDILTFNNS